MVEIRYLKEDVYYNGYILRVGTIVEFNNIRRAEDAYPLITATICAKKISFYICEDKLRK